MTVVYYIQDCLGCSTASSLLHVSTIHNKLMYTVGQKLCHSVLDQNSRFMAEIYTSCAS